MLEFNDFNADVEKIGDSRKSTHVKKLEDTEKENVGELDDTDEPENITKTSKIDEKLEGIEDSIENDESESKENSKKK